MIRGAPKPVGGHAPFALSFDIVILTSFLLGGFTVTLHAQQEVEAVIGGEVVDAQTGAPLPDAFVEIEGTRVGAFTDEAGRYQLAGLPPGRVVLRVRRIGYAVARLPLTLRAGERVTRRVELAVSALRMEDLRVTADVGGRAEGELGTADVIDEEAIENQTAVSLQGLLELIPGQPLAAPGLDGIQQFSLRSVPTAGIGGTGGIANQRSAFDLTSFGTSIVLDGVPLSNNANLQTLGPRGEVFIPTAAGGGIDLRRIPASTLERVEVIRGVPSVRYGDLTQGAVIVYTKAGRVEPRLSLQGDVRTTSGAAVGGERLGGGHTGTLTLDLTRTVLAPGRDDVGSRVSGQLAHRLATGQSPRAGLPAFALDSRLDFFQVLEDRPLEPDVLPGFAARSRDRGMRLSERARVRLGETSELRLTAALSATQQRSFSRSLHLPVSVPITDRLTEGTQEGEFLIGEYVSMVDVEGDPWQLFARLELDAETRLFASEHRLRPGVVLRREWADGAGIQFDVSRPPQIGFNGVRGFDRPRPYDAIPPLVASALYLDDRVTALFGGGDVRLDVQAGVRLDLLHDGSSWASGVRDAAFQPRLNVELSPLPWLRLRAGAGLTAKLPAVGDLFPGPQYFDVVNVNFFADDPAERLAVLSTFIEDPTNDELGFIRGRRVEAGVEIGLGGGAGLSLVAFSDRIDDGIGIDFEPDFLLRDRYDVIEVRGDGRPPELVQPPVGADTIPILIQRPANLLRLDSRGLELTASLPEIRPLNTRLEAQAAWTESEFSSAGLDFGTRLLWDAFQLDPDRPRSPFWEGRVGQGERAILTGRAIYHQPEVGLVVTAILQHYPNEFQQVEAATDTLAFAGYVTRRGELVFVPPERRSDPELHDLRRTRTGLLLERQRTPADWLFSLKVAKTLPLDGRLSLYAFNAFDREGKEAELGQNARAFPPARVGLEVQLPLGGLFR